VSGPSFGYAQIYNWRNLSLPQKRVGRQIKDLLMAVDDAQAAKPHSMTIAGASVASPATLSSCGACTAIRPPAENNPKSWEDAVFRNTKLRYKTDRTAAKFAIFINAKAEARRYPPNCTNSGFTSLLTCSTKGRGRDIP
jgi:hypothetical protein